jgi:hypothetical protein
MKTLAPLAIAAALVGCGSSHIAPYVPRQRDYQMPEVKAAESNAAPGSLWKRPARDHALLRCAAARQRSAVKIEIADAKRSADTDLAFFLIGLKINEFPIDGQVVTPVPWLDLQSAPSHQRLQRRGLDRTNRAAHGHGSPSCARRLNGNLFIEGHRGWSTAKSTTYLGRSLPSTSTRKTASRAHYATPRSNSRAVALADNQERGWVSHYLAKWPLRSM